MRTIRLVIVGCVLLVLAVAAPVNAGEKAFPKTNVVPDGKGGYRIDVVDRPSNATPGTRDRAPLLQLQNK